MKTLFTTERTVARSKDTRDLGGPLAGAPAQDGVAWFELVLHEGPPDDTTWEGCGQTVAYWRENFARLRSPQPWRVRAHGIERVAPAVIPD